MTDKYLLFIMEINCLRFPRVPPLLCAGVPLRGRCQTFSFLNSVWGHASFLMSHSLWSLLTTTREWRTHGKSWKAYRRLHNTSSSSLQCLSPQTLYFSSRLDVLTHRVMEKARWEANIRPEPRAHTKKKKDLIALERAHLWQMKHKIELNSAGLCGSVSEIKLRYWCWMFSLVEEFIFQDAISLELL